MASPIQALYETLQTELRGYSPLWGGRVEAVESAPSDVQKLYITYFVVSGGRLAENGYRNRHEYVVAVKAVALNLLDALTAQEAISVCLHNSGAQDLNPRLTTRTDWKITAVTADRLIYATESKDTGMVYHAGNQYQIKMEAL